MNVNELDTLIHAKQVLDNIPCGCRTVEYVNICFEINCVIHRRCQHNIIFDEVDVDVEKSESICYCDKCYFTFNIDFFRDYLLYLLDNSKRDQWKIITNKGIYDLYDIYVLRNQICFQINSVSNMNNVCAYYLKDILNCHADDSIVYINN